MSGSLASRSPLPARLWQIHFWCVLFRVALATAAGAAGSAAGTSTLAWEQLPALPDPEGFAGVFAGVAGDGTLLVAGGANFPGLKPWAGGVKVWHDVVFGLSGSNGVWRVLGRLPRPRAYGVALTTDRGVACIGGSDSSGPTREVFELDRRDGRLVVRPLPSLPVPLASAAGARVGSRLVVGGGTEAPGEKSASARLFLLDSAAASPAWRELPPCPGPGRFLPLAAVLGEEFVLAAGAALVPGTNGTVVRAPLRDAWAFSFGSGAGGRWRRLRDLPRPAVAAASPAVPVPGGFLVLGGDDGSHAGFAPSERHPGFASDILRYEAGRDEWVGAGRVPAPRVTLPAVWWRGFFVLPSGEVRPGMRSPQVWQVRVGEAR